MATKPPTSYLCYLIKKINANFEEIEGTHDFGLHHGIMIMIIGIMKLKFPSMPFMILFITNWRFLGWCCWCAHPHDAIHFRTRACRGHVACWPGCDGQLLIARFRWFFWWFFSWFVLMGVWLFFDGVWWFFLMVFVGGFCWWFCWWFLLMFFFVQIIRVAKWDSGRVTPQRCWILQPDASHRGRCGSERGGCFWAAPEDSLVAVLGPWEKRSEQGSRKDRNVKKCQGVTSWETTLCWILLKVLLYENAFILKGDPDDLTILTHVLLNTTTILEFADLVFFAITKNDCCPMSGWIMMDIYRSCGSAAAAVVHFFSAQMRCMRQATWAAA